MYLGCGLIAFIPSMFVNRVGVPHVGASGAIAAVMAAYFVFFPKVKFNLRFFFVIAFNLSCYAYFFFWILLQVLIGLTADTSKGGVAWEIHLGGFVAGLIWALLVKRLRLA